MPATPIAQAAPAAETSAPAPQPSAKKAPDYGAELTQAIADMGLNNRELPRGMKLLERTEAATEAATTEEADPSAGKPAPKAKPAEKAPPTQSSLSSGYAKLNRQQRAVDQREAALAQREEALKAQEADITNRRGAFEKESAEKLSEVERLAKLFDEDEETVLETIAKRKGKTVEDFYDRLTRRRVNGGERHPTDEISKLKAEFQAELEKIQKETAAEKATREEREAKAQAAEAERAKEAELAKHAEAEQAKFAGWVRANEGNKFPLLSQEAEADIGKHAYRIATDYNAKEAAAAARENRAPVYATFERVALHLEEVLSFHAHREEQAKLAAPAASAAAADDDVVDEDEEEEPKKKKAPPPRPAAKAPAKSGEKPALKAMASAPKTLTQGIAQPRTGIRRPAAHGNATDDERLGRALASAGWD